MLASEQLRRFTTPLPLDWARKACHKAWEEIKSATMKTLLLILALLLQSPNNPHIEVKYDRFGDTTALILTHRINALSDVVDLGGGSYYVKPGASPLDVVRFHVIAVSKGKTITRNALITLALTSRSSNWIYLKQTNTLKMILNGAERVDLGVMDRMNSDVDRLGVTEQLAVTISLANLERLAKADKIEVQISSDEFEFSKDQISDLKEFVSRFPAPTK